MEYAVEMDSSAIMYIPNLIKIVSGIQKVIRVGYTDSMVITFFQNKESRLSISVCATSQEMQM
jgi:hypothetical protein